MSTMVLLAIAPPSIFDQISYDEALSVEIQVDMEALTEDFRSEEKHPASFTYKDADGVQQVWDIKMKLRGKFRRMKCTETPPMKLYFDKTALANAGLSAYNDLKLVNYCEEDKEIARQLLIKEYLAYKMYHHLTEESFKVQLLKITYKDTKTNKKTKRWAFVIEDTAQLKARLGSTKHKGLAPSDTNVYDKEQVHTMALFQYMIGNTDWRITDQKNIKIFEKEGKYMAIPYDFDFSGLVNPSYAFANTDYQLNTLTERVYLGNPKDAMQLASTIELFENRKTAIYTEVKKCKYLSMTEKATVLDYLDSFYDHLNLKTILRSIPQL